jgi:hypothetical protein
LVAAGALARAAVPQGEPEPKAALPREQYDALVREYQAATSGDYMAWTDAQRAEKRACVDGLPLRFLALAEHNAADPVAIDALTQVLWMESNTSHPAGGADSPGSRALALLLSDHVRSDRIGPGCQRLVSCMRKECEPLLRAVLAENPHADAKALACISLAQFLDARRRRLELFADAPEQASRFADLLDPEYRDSLVRDSAKTAAEIEALYERAAAEYGDVKMLYGGTVGDAARSSLYELRHLSVGNEAPDIEGEDQHGERFKLSDYRGKVVLLDFWQQS